MVQRFLDTIFISIFTLGSIVIPIYGSILHFYTVYLNSIENGFWSALVSFCLPVISEVWYSMDIIKIHGFSHFYITLIFIFIIIFVLTLLSSYGLKNEKE